MPQEQEETKAECGAKSYEQEAHPQWPRQLFVAQPFARLREDDADGRSLPPGHPWGWARVASEARPLPLRADRSLFQQASEHPSRLLMHGQSLSEQVGARLVARLVDHREHASRGTSQRLVPCTSSSIILVAWGGVAGASGRLLSLANWA